MCGEGLHPLKTSLCVMSRADNSAGLILASSPTFKKVFGKSNVGRAYELPFDVKTRRFSYANARRQGIEVTPQYVRFIESWAKVTYIVPPRMDEYIKGEHANSTRVSKLPVGQRIFFRIRLMKGLLI